MPINLELWEINLILNELAKLPYEEVSGIIHRIKEQMEPSKIHCKECVWFAPAESNTVALAIKQITGGSAGICRKVTYSTCRPVMTREDGYCHRAEKKTE